MAALHHICLSRDFGGLHSLFVFFIALAPILFSYSHYIFHIAFGNPAHASPRRGVGYQSSESSALAAYARTQPVARGV